MTVNICAVVLSFHQGCGSKDDSGQPAALTLRQASTPIGPNCACPIVYYWRRNTRSNAI